MPSRHPVLYIVTGYIVCMLAACLLGELVFGVVDNSSLFALCVYGLVMFGLYDYDGIRFM